MKVYSKHIDWGDVKITKDIMKGYVMPKYGKKNWVEDDSWIDIIVDDVFNTFYMDEEEEANSATCYVENFLAMVEFKKATVKDYTKLVVTDGMVDYVLEKYGNDWKCEAEISSVILGDLWLKYEKVSDKGKGKEAYHDHLKVKGKDAEHDHFKVNKADKGKGKKVEHDYLKVNKDDKGKGKVHAIQNRLEKLEVDLARAIKAKQEAKKSKNAKEVKLEKEAKKAKLEAKKAELKAKEGRKAKKAKEAMLAELKAKKAKEAMLAKVF
nr:hypothetical protein [Tanacetum cinerariifolium]